MSNWGTLQAELILQLGGGRSGDANIIKAKSIEAIEHFSDEHFYTNEQRFTFATVASQQGYGEGTGASNIPRGIVRVVGEYLFVDIDQDSANRTPIKRFGPELLDSAYAGDTTTSEPNAWTFFAQQIELYPLPDGVHDVRGRAVVAPGTPIKRVESGVWKFYKPYTTSFVSGNEMVDGYPAGGAETNAWFTDPLAYALILNYTLYILHSAVYHSAKGQDQRALQRSLEAQRKLEDKVKKTHLPKQIEEYGGGDW